MSHTGSNPGLADTIQACCSRVRSSSGQGRVAVRMGAAEAVDRTVAAVRRQGARPRLWYYLQPRPTLTLTLTTDPNPDPNPNPSPEPNPNQAPPASRSTWRSTSRVRAFSPSTWRQVSSPNRGGVSRVSRAACRGAR